MSYNTVINNEELYDIKYITTITYLIVYFLMYFIITHL